MEDHELDQLLAGALQAEPPAGMEQRVLARIRPRNRARWWLVPGLVAAGVAVMAVRLRINPEESLVLKPPPAPVAVNLRHPPPRPRPVAPPAKIEKRSQFPSPQRLSAEEKALLAFLGANRERAGLALQTEDAIEIEPIRIPPLRSDGGQ